MVDAGSASADEDLVWLGRAWRWLDRYTDGIRGWLILLGFLSGIGFALFPGDLHDRDVARDLESRGGMEVSQEVLVHVHYVSGRGGGYKEVDAVRARLSGVPGLVELAAANAGSQDRVDDEVAEGWQPPNEATGYQAPLAIRVRHDDEGRVIAAMAEDDYTYWSGDNHDPEIGLGLGVGGVVLGGMSFAVNFARLRRSERRRAR